MSKENVLLLCNMAESYFFPAISNVQYVFKHPKSKKYMMFMKVIRELHIPVLNSFFGDWYKKVKNYSKIVIFDLGYQPGMEKYIFRKNPGVDIYFYNWNTIDNKRKEMKINSFYDRKRIYSNDPRDCEKYGLKFNSSFYSADWVERIETSRLEENGQAVWLGVDKGRKEWLEMIEDALNKLGVKTDIRIVGGGYSEHTHSRMSYEDYCRWMINSTYLLDINQVGQTATTLRVMEAIFFGKKLITNNTNIAGMDFYNPNNIYVIDPTAPDCKQLNEFINAKFVPYSEEIKQKYEFSGWIEKFIA